MNDWECELTLAIELDRTVVRGRRKSCAPRQQEDWRHTVSKINRAVGMKKPIEDSNRSNIPAKREREAEDSRSDERSWWDENLLIPPYVTEVCDWTPFPPYMRTVLHTWTDRVNPCTELAVGEYEKLAEMPQNAYLHKSCFNNSWDKRLPVKIMSEREIEDIHCIRGEKLDIIEKQWIIVWKVVLSW